MQKYCLIQLLEPATEGSAFHWKDWPLHLTVLSRFTYPTKREDVVQLLRPAVSQHTAMITRAIRDEHFGTDKKIAVTIMELHSQLHQLHRDLTNLLLENGAEFDEPQYMLDHYLPHATVQKSGRVSVNERVAIHRLTLVDMFHNQDIQQRRLLESFALPSGQLSND